MIIMSGSVFDVKRGIIAHGCNNRGVMGSGVAKVVKEMYPAAYEHYTASATPGLGWTPPIMGKVFPVKVTEEPLWIANCITQEGYGRTGEKIVSYDAVDACFEYLAKMSRRLELNVHFPFVGAGLGGGDPDVLKAIFNHHFPEENGTLHILPGEYSGL